MRIDAPCENQISKLRELWEEAFGDTEDFLDGFYKMAFAKERCRCVTIDGEVAATLYWFDCDVKDETEYVVGLQADLQAASLELSQTVEMPNHRIAYIYAVTTAKKFRGHGICHKLMEDTHKYLRECGYEGAILVPGNEGLFRFYEDIGYQTCSRIREIRCIGEPQSISFRQIEKAEYAKLRREYLPEGGVIQEGVSLDFLQTQAKFYAGEDFVLAACREGHILRGIELLGNEKVAAKVVHALGYKEGYFCMPEGNEWRVIDGEYEKSTPFGMYYPLGKDSKMPGYFGLAFD